MFITGPPVAIISKILMFITGGLLLVRFLMFITGGLLVRFNVYNRWTISKILMFVTLNLTNRWTISKILMFITGGRLVSFNVS